MTNSLTFAGASGNLLSLRSTDGIGEWFVIAPTTRSASFVDVQLSNASGGQTIHATDSIDSGDNTNWTFAAVNQPPIAVDDVRTTDQNNPLVTTSASLVANDIDPDGPSLSVSSVGGAVNGFVSISGPNVTFTPDKGFTGVAGFDYSDRRRIHRHGPRYGNRFAGCHSSGHDLCTDSAHDVDSESDRQRYCHRCSWRDLRFDLL
ncbi:MAG: cadherin-like domain-containing protein [Acidobacteria bacterium]|nr:cadherin-like domain-containing protein [Acidobacteriota bacterium]